MHVCPLLGIVCRQKVCYFLNVLIVEETSIYSELYMFKLKKKQKKKTNAVKRVVEQPHKFHTLQLL